MKAEAQHTQPAADWRAQYPEQTRKMIAYLRRGGVPANQAEDMVEEAFARGLESFNASRGLHFLQWVWYVLRHNVLPHYRRKKKNEHYTEPLEDDPPDEPAEIHDTLRPEQFVELLRRDLPSDLLSLLDAMADVIAETDSRHIYKVVAARLNISMPECRNRVKRLKRMCNKLRKSYSS